MSADNIYIFDRRKIKHHIKIRSVQTEHSILPEVSIQNNSSESSVLVLAILSALPFYLQ